MYGIYFLSFRNTITPFKLRDKENKFPEIGGYTVINNTKIKKLKLSPTKMKTRSFKLRRAASIRNMEVSKSIRFLDKQNKDFSMSNFKNSDIKRGNKSPSK